MHDAVRDWKAEYQKKSESYNELREHGLAMEAMFYEQKKRADEAENRLHLVKNAINSWREFYSNNGPEEERRLIEDVLKIIEMAEVLEVEDRTQMQGKE